MITIQSYRPTNNNNMYINYPRKMSFSGDFNAEKNKKQSEKMAAAEILGAAVAGTLVVMLIKGKAGKISFEEALAKKGVELKDGIAFVKGTGQKFNGKIKRNIKISEKETINFENGIMTEKLYHNMFGRELEGEFYVDGKLNLRVGRHVGTIKKSFPFYKYENDKRIASGDISGTGIRSVFDWARNYIK